MPHHFYTERHHKEINCKELSHNLDVTKISRKQAELWNVFKVQKQNFKAYFKFALHSPFIFLYYLTVLFILGCFFNWLCCCFPFGVGFIKRQFKHIQMKNVRWNHPNPIVSHHKSINPIAWERQNEKENCINIFKRCRIQTPQKIHTF